MKRIFALLILISVLLSACGSAATDAQGTAMALAVHLTLLANPTNTEEAGPAPTQTSTMSEVAVAETGTSPPLPAPTQPAPAQISEPTETPYVIPGWPLFRSGDTGVEVYAIQHLLRSHGYNLTVDGNFGPQTRQQVLNFQLAKGLSTDGIVGPQTWTALIQGKTIKVGNTGQAVRAVQRLLRDKFGYQLAVDGDFGPITDNVVVDFQNAYDLTVDRRPAVLEGTHCRVTAGTVALGSHCAWDSGAEFCPPV